MDRSRAKLLMDLALKKHCENEKINELNRQAFVAAEKDFLLEFEDEVNSAQRKDILPLNNDVTLAAQQTYYENVLTHAEAEGSSSVPIDTVTLNVEQTYPYENVLTHAEAEDSSTAPKPHIVRPLVSYECSSEEDNGNEDFGSDDSDNDPSFNPTVDPDHWDISDLSDLENNENTLTRHRVSHPEQWKKNVAKRERNLCKPYKTAKKEHPAKYPKPIDCTNCKYKCTAKFTPDERVELCKNYWALSNFQRKNDFIINHVHTSQPKRRKVDPNNVKSRSVSKFYYFENKSEKHRVCAKFFEKTLCISNGPITTAINGKNDFGIFTGTDKRGKKEPGNKTSKEGISLVKKHIESFPVMESHYCRQSSKKFYLDAGLSIWKMYELYGTHFTEEHNITNPVSEKTYRRIFCNNYNYSFFRPKKDKCPTCSKYEEADIAQRRELEPDYLMHLVRKGECNEAKENDKNRSKTDSTFISCTFDLQKVLQLPFSNVSLFYYSRKICVYNLTIYVADGSDAHCFTWNELHGKRGSNEIGSILFKFFNSLPVTISQISLFCDTCGGQNRNQQVAAIMMYAVQNIPHINTIELKFLESGHSHMECDSMHSAIESEKKNRSAFTMADWTNIFESSRSKKKNVGKYKVHLLKFSDFFDLHDLAQKTVKNRNKDENGDLVSWLKTKRLKFEKEYPSTIFYAYDHSSEYKKIDTAGRGRRRAGIVELKPAYQSLLPISVAKKKDLVKLCEAGHIPEEVVPWYKTLPTSDEFTSDRLPEPAFDEEEEIDS